MIFAAVFAATSNSTAAWLEHRAKLVDSVLGYGVGKLPTRSTRSVDGEGRCAQHDVQQQLPPPRQANKGDAKHHRRKPEVCERINPERCEWTGPSADAAMEAAAGAVEQAVEHFDKSLLLFLSPPRGFAELKKSQRE